MGAMAEEKETSNLLADSLQRTFSPSEVETACRLLLRTLRPSAQGRGGPFDHSDLAALVVLAEAEGFSALPERVAPGEEAAAGKLMAFLLLYRSTLAQRMAQALLAAVATIEVYGRGHEVVRDLLRQGANWGYVRREGPA